MNPNPKDMSNFTRLDWIEHGKKEYILGEAISAIVYRNAQVVVSGSQGTIVRYADKMSQVLPPADPDMLSRIKVEEPIVATQMDDKNEEGIVGTAFGSIVYVQFGENNSMVKLVSKVSQFMDPIDLLRYDNSNQNVLLSGTGKNNGDMKLLTSGNLDHIFTFPQQAFGAVAFVTASPKDKKNRMIGHMSGFIKIVSINSLKVSQIYKVDLEDGELLTCGVYSASGHNFAVGTSFGSIFLGMIKKDPMANNKSNIFMARVDRVSHGTENAVTSIQMTSFDPTGTLLAAFDNGWVRCWHSSIKHEVYQRLAENTQGEKKKRNRRREAYDLSDLGEVQFDLIDKFDMFENPHGEADLTEEKAEELAMMFGVSTIVSVN